MAASSDVLKQGYVKVQSKKLGVWKKRWLVLRKRSSAGQARLEKYKDETRFIDVGISFANATVVELCNIETVIRMSESVRKHGVCVISKINEFQFSADSEVEANNWLAEIKEAVAVSHKTQNSFKVYMMKDVKLRFHGECNMFITSDTIKLLDNRNGYEIVAWPFNTLRRYGVERNQFQIEAGRSSETGEGVFNFDAEDPEAIYQRVHEVAQQRLQQARRENNHNSSRQNNGSSGTLGSDRAWNDRSNNRDDYSYDMGRGGGTRSGRRTINNNYSQEQEVREGGRSNDNVYPGEEAWSGGRKFNDLSSKSKKTNLSNGKLGSPACSLSPQYSSRTESISSRATDDSDEWPEYQGDVASEKYSCSGKSTRSAKSSTSSKANGGRMSPDCNRSIASDYSQDRRSNTSDIRNRPLPIPGQRSSCKSERSDNGGEYDNPYSDATPTSRSSNRKR